VLPGLVNAHCHLAYTCLAGLIPPPSSFTSWIHSIKAAKDTHAEEELRASWLRGAEMLLAGGVTMVGDAEAFPDLLPETARATRLQVRPFLEIIRVRAELDPEEPVFRAVDTLERLERGGLSGGLSPHAPYSTTPALLAACSRAAAQKGLPVAIHVAESAEEFEMFVEGGGALHDWLSANGRDCTDCGRGSPVAHLARTSLLGPHVAAIHVNYLAEGDAALLGGSETRVVHCPRSHDYFGHDPFPHDTLVAAGVEVALGTDSLATVRTWRGGEPPELDLIAEMAAFRRGHPGVPPDAVLRMATAAGARALGLEGEVGVIAPGARADLLAVPAAGGATEWLEGFTTGAKRPGAVMVAGNWLGEGGVNRRR
jgi:cytosine/adenosine deaminase-related metal-dependent hydrolase